MGLIKAALNAVGGNLADQYKEYIYCDSLPNDVLATKGHKRVGSRGTNKGDDNVITDGSAIAVNEGQCALIVVDGKVSEVAAEAGVFEFKSALSPSVFSGNLGDSLLNSLKDIGTRISYGGQAAHDQRVYYINMKEIMGNRYGTVTPIPFRVVDNNIGLDVDVTLRCNGEYTYRITNPVLFYTNVCGNFADTYNRSNLDSALKSEIVTALQPALGKISEQGVRPSMLPGQGYGNMRRAERGALQEMGRSTRNRCCQLRDESSEPSRGSAGDDHQPPEDRRNAQSQHGGCNSGRGAGFRNEDRCRKPGRRNDGIHGHEYGSAAGRIQRAGALSDGRTAAGSGTAAAGCCSTGCPSGKLDMSVRYIQHRKVLC